MTLVGTREIMDAAVASGTGVGAFNVIHLETAEGLVAGAEAAGLPVILQISQNCAQYHGGLEAIALGTMAVARGASVPVAVHLDHAEDEELAEQAISLGFGSVMFDASHLDYGENVEATRRVAGRARAAGVYLEAELGQVLGKGGAHDPGVRTDPAEAREFVSATGVDALAVAVGSSHAMTERTASLDTDLIGGLHRGRPGAAGPARIVRSIGRAAAGRHPRGHDEDQRLDPLQRALHAGHPGLPRGASGGRRLSLVPRARARGRDG